MPKFNHSQETFHSSRFRNTLYLRDTSLTNLNIDRDVFNITVPAVSRNRIQASGNNSVLFSVNLRKKRPVFKRHKKPTSISGCLLRNTWRVAFSMSGRKL